MCGLKHNCPHVLVQDSNFKYIFCNLCRTVIWREYKVTATVLKWIAHKHNIHYIAKSIGAPSNEQVWLP